jgi:hypothetical protein
MQIHTNLASGGLNKVVGAEVKARSANLEKSELSFAESDSLDRSLSKVPDVRTEEVARARSLVADPSYPPRETIRRLSNLLAMEMVARNEE